MQQAFSQHRGALHRSLKISQSERIPTTLLVRIVDAKLGNTIKNPTQTGKRRILVTTPLKRKANAALNARRV